MAAPALRAKLTTKQAATIARNLSSSRGYATISPVTTAARNHKIVVVGGGTAGLSISHQFLLRSKSFAEHDIAVIDPAEWHHYQPGWTLVSGGLKTKEELRQPLAKLVDPKLKFYNQQVQSFSPEQNMVKLQNGDELHYEHLVVVPGIDVQLDSIQGLSDALSNPDAPVSTVYKYEYCDKATRNIKDFQKGSAIFTQPAGIIKCAGAPQKVMWLAWDRWRKAGLYSTWRPSSSPINITFATGLPVMFGVPKYNATLEKLREKRGIEGLFQHDLVAIEGNNAVFARPNGQEKITKKFDLLHVVPKMGPHAFVKNSLLADQAGYVDVDQYTLQHTKYKNVWSAGDASSLPTSKTAAAITAQTPALVNNVLNAMESKKLRRAYDGYTSCPLTTGKNQVLLAEFKYGGVPKETFRKYFDQGTPRYLFFYLKRDFFPWVYKHFMVKGNWLGPKGRLIRD